MEIFFDPTNPSCVHDEYANYGTLIGKQISERTIRIRVDNLSKTKAVEGLEVKLTDIDKCELEDKGKLPVRLKGKNYPKSHVSHTIPIDDYRFFDVILAYRQDPKLPLRDFAICHIEQGNNHAVISLLEFRIYQTNRKS